MDPHSRPPPAHCRRALEYDYLAINYQITQLMESREREHAALTEVGRLLERLEVKRSLLNSSFQSLHWEQSIAPVLVEVDSVLRLCLQTSLFRERFRILHGQLAELGRQLNYW